MLKTSFWVQIVCYYFEYLTAEVFFGPTYSQINQMIPSTAQGIAVALFSFFGAISGSLATYVLGVFGDKFKERGDDFDPQTYGTTLGVAVLVGYLGCIPFFLLNSREYSKLVRKQRQIE